MNSNLLLAILFFVIFIVNNFFTLSLQGGILNSSTGNVILAFVIFLFGAKYIKDLERNREQIELRNCANVLSNIFLFCLSLLAFQSVFGQAIFGFNVSDFTIGNFFLEQIEKIQYMIIILTIVFGSLIFYVNREEIKYIEEEGKKEILEEKRRLKEFDMKFIRLKKIPLLGRILKWFYKEGKWILFLLFSITSLGFLLRFYGLGNILPFSDEYTHLANVKKMYEGIIIEDDRGMFLNHTIKFLYDYFGYNINNFFETSKQGLFLARIPGVIISIFTIFIFYLIGKELIGKRLGLLLALLLAISPMNIEMAKFIREYIYFFFLLSLYILLALKIDTHKIITKNNIVFSFSTLCILFFSFFIEPLSTLKIIIFFMFSTIVALIGANISKIRNLLKYKKILSIFTLFLIIVFIIFYNKFSAFLGLNTKYTWLEYFIVNTKNYPSGLNNFKYLSLFLISFGSILYFLKSNISRYKIILLVTLFTVFIVFYVFLFDRYIQIRYAYYVFIPFILLLGLGIYFILSYISKFKIKYITLLLLSIFSIHTIIYSVNGYEYGKWNRITDHYIEDYIGTAKFIKDNTQNINILITTYPSINYLAGINSDKITHYRYIDENRFRILEEIVSLNISGYIILDNRRNGLWVKGLPREDFKIGVKDVYLLSNFNRIQIYKW